MIESKAFKIRTEKLILETPPIDGVILKVNELCLVYYFKKGTIENLHVLHCFIKKKTR